jgi:hypothetical protein
MENDMNYPTEMQEKMDAAANLAAMQRTARQRLTDNTFDNYLAREEQPKGSSNE